MSFIKAALLLSIGFIAAHGASAAGKRGSEQRTVDCTVSQLNCKNRCPPWPATDWQLCLALCDLAYSLCLAAPDPDSRTVRQRPNLQVAPRMGGN